MTKKEIDAEAAFAAKAYKNRAAINREVQEVIAAATAASRRMTMPIAPESLRGARIVNPAPGPTKWGWLLDVASNWQVPLIVVPWPGATLADCGRIRGMLMHNPGTTYFRWAVRLHGDSIVIARFALRPSLLHNSDIDRAESRARFASLKELGWQNPTGPIRRRSPFRD
jgi:hypothetical protein